MKANAQLEPGIAVVTGAAQGIGLAVARALADAGVTVAALDRQAGVLHGACAQREALHPFAVDLREADEVEAVIARIEQVLGPIAYLASVAGVLHTGSLLDGDDQTWLQSFAVNTHGSFHVCRAVARRMRERRRGAIVGVSSNAASTPRLDMGAYAASKAASAQFIRCLGLELAEYGVRCNLVSPGSTDTEMQRRYWRNGVDAETVIAGSLAQHRLGIPLRRIAPPEDIADSVLFLLSDSARQITLQDLIVDGGATLGR